MVGERFLRGDCARGTGSLGRSKGLLRRALTATLLALGGVTAAAAQPASGPHDGECATPALWVVHDEDTTVYLFGTFHAHDGKAHWFDHAVKDAFERSDELVLETLVPETPEAINAALVRHRARKLASASPALPAAQPSAGLAGARQAMSAARSAGLSVDQGADAVLHKAADQLGKPVIGLESFEFQLGMYDRLPGTSPARTVQKQAAPNHGVARQMKQMLTAWNHGDHRTFEQVVAAVHSQSPEAYQIMFAERNAAWAQWVGARMQRPGTVFVAVGTGHLVGRDSLQALLASRGFTSTRVY